MLYVKLFELSVVLHSRTLIWFLGIATDTKKVEPDIKWAASEPIEAEV